MTDGGAASHTDVRPLLDVEVDSDDVCGGHADVVARQQGDERTDARIVADDPNAREFVIYKRHQVDPGVG